MLNLMNQFASESRITDVFRDEAIAQIRIAYRICEYLNPDPIFKPLDLNPVTVSMFLRGEIVMAVATIIHELDIDIDCSLTMSGLLNEGTKLAEHLYSKNKGE